MRLPLLVLVAFAGVLALQLFGVIKGWQNARHWRSPASWSDLPLAARVFIAVTAIGGLVGGVLLAMATHRH
jgi:hypothetical protein